MDPNPIMPMFAAPLLFPLLLPALAAVAGVVAVVVLILRDHVRRTAVVVDLVARSDGGVRQGAGARFANIVMN